MVCSPHGDRYQRGGSLSAVARATYAAIDAALPTPGLVRITAGNYSGRLGKSFIYLCPGDNLGKQQVRQQWRSRPTVAVAVRLWRSRKSSLAGKLVAQPAETSIRFHPDRASIP